MEDKDTIETCAPVQRLCNEIQLFDLCDLDSCNYKQGRFCTNSDLIMRFERIAEAETRIPSQYMEEELDDDAEGADDGDFDDDCGGEDGDDGVDWDD